MAAILNLVFGFSYSTFLSAFVPGYDIDFEKWHELHAISLNITPCMTADNELFLKI